MVDPVSSFSAQSAAASSDPVIGVVRVVTSSPLSEKCLCRRPASGCGLDQIRLGWGASRESTHFTASCQKRGGEGEVEGGSSLHELLKRLERGLFVSLECGKPENMGQQHRLLGF